MKSQHNVDKKHKKKSATLPKVQDNAKRLLIVCLALFVSSIMLFSASLVYFHKSNQAKQRTAYAPAQPFSLGQLVRMGKVEVRFDDIRRESGSQPFVAPDGSEYVVAKLTVHNISDAPLQVMPSIDTYAKTSDGTVSVLAMYAYKDPFRAGELPAGETIHGEVGYLVKKDVDAKAYIDASWSGGVLPFKLEN